MADMMPDEAEDRLEHAIQEAIDDAILSGDVVTAGELTAILDVVRVR